MFVHTHPDGPQRQEVLSSVATTDFQLPDGTTMRCLTPEIFDDAIYSLIFSIYHRLYRPEDSTKSNIWFPGRVRRRVFVALLQADRWADLGEHFEYKLGAMPFSATVKTAISTEFFGFTEPNLFNACRELANEPGFMSTTETVWPFVQ